MNSNEFTDQCPFYYRPQTKFAKVMFLHVSVSHSVHGGGVVSQHALQVTGGVYPSMLYRFPGPHPRGKLRGLAGGVSRPTPGGCESQHALRQTPPHLTATTAGGSHPTGMHSCFC